MSLQSLEKQTYRFAVGVPVLLGAMLLLPYLVHLLPAQGGVQMGARLLPIFYAPLAAVLLFDVRAALVAGLLAPLLNYLILGSPAQPMLVLLTVELLVFCLTAGFLFRRRPRLVLIGPLSYLTAVACAAAFLWVLPLPPLQAAPFFVSSLANAVPGMLMLLALNILLVRLSKE